MPKQKIKIVFMGTPEFACPSLEALIQDERFEIPAVITQPDRKVGRKQELMPPPIKNLALKYNLSVLQPEALKKNAEIVELLQVLKPDFIVVVAYGQILNKKILDIPRYGCINIHGSLLPKYRGASPVEQSLLQDDKETGVTIMAMDEKMDHGEIYVVKKTEIEENDNALTLREKLSKLGAKYLPDTLLDIIDNQLQSIPQNHSEATYCQKITKENGLVDFKQQTARQIIQMIKAYTPWPGCFMEMKGKKLKLLQATTSLSLSEHHQPPTPNSEPTNLKLNHSAEIKLQPGEHKIADQKLFIGTLEGNLLPLEVQLEGKKAMPIGEFLKGNQQLFNF